MTGPVMSAQQQAIMDDWSVRPIRIVLRDPFGALIREWLLRESHGDTGGMGTLGQLFEYSGTDEMRIPFSPIPNTPAKFFFELTRLPNEPL